MQVHPTRDRIQVGKVDELATHPRTIVPLGPAPDGLPWLLRADRSAELGSLFTVVPNVFGLSRVEDLPKRVRDALEHEVAAGLMGVHETTIDGKPARAFVARRKLKRLLGPTLLAQLLETNRRERQDKEAKASITNVGAMAVREQDDAMLDAVERSIQALRAKRHLLMDLDRGQAYSCSVRDEDRALRVPTDPIRPLAWESFSGLGEVDVKFQSFQSGHWITALADKASFLDSLTRLAQGNRGGQIEFRFARQRLLDQIVDVAQGVDELHQKGRVHGDLAPGNVLICAEGALAFDGLDVEAGNPATAATFEWAAPEQIVGHPVDPRTDVYALGRMAIGLIGGVRFGEQTSYIVPIGGDRSRRVELLKSEGVFLDITGTQYTRAWQKAWQDLLGRATHFDPAKRPASGAEFADLLAQLLNDHPILTGIDLSADFGDITPIETSNGVEFAHVAND